MAISLISSHVCTRRGDKIRAVLTVVEAWSRVVFCHPSRRGSNSAVAPVVACVVLTFTLAFVDEVRGAIVDCVNTCIHDPARPPHRPGGDAWVLPDTVTTDTRHTLRRRPAPGCAPRAHTAPRSPR